MGAAVTFDDGWRDNLTVAWPIMAELGVRPTIFLVRDWVSAGRTAEGEFLRPAEVAEMSKAGVEFGAHTVSHPHLDRLTPAEAEAEMRGSREAVEGWTGRECRVFAYPFGDHTIETADLARRVFAVSVIVGGGWWAEGADRAQNSADRDPRGHELDDRPLCRAPRRVVGPTMKAALKAVAFFLALIVVSPLVVLTRLEEWLFGLETERIFGSCKELLALIPTPLGNALRRAYYWGSCQGVAKLTSINFGSMIAHRRTIIADGVVIGSFSIIGSATIGRNVLIAPKVSILSGKYPHGRPEERESHGKREMSFEMLSIGDELVHRAGCRGAGEHRLQQHRRRRERRESRSSRRRDGDGQPGAPRVARDEWRR